MSNDSEKKEKKKGLITVVIKDSNGGRFIKSWRAEASTLDAIKWAVSSEDAPIYLEEDKITEIEIIRD